MAANKHREKGEGNSSQWWRIGIQYLRAFIRVCHGIVVATIDLLRPAQRINTEDAEESSQGQQLNTTLANGS
jgi:hypothetical protein